MAKNKLKAKDLQGLAIRHVDNRTYLCDWFDKKVRVVDNDEAVKYSLWQMRFPGSLLAGCFLFSYTENVPLGVLLGVAIFAVSTVVYELAFVKNLAEATEKEQNKVKSIKREKTYEKMARELSNIRLILGCLLTLTLSVLLVVYAKMEGYTGFYMIFTVALSIACFFFSGLSLYSLYYKKKNNL